MKFALRKAKAEGRNRAGCAIYPAGSWTLWRGEKFVGWNWSWERIASLLRCARNQGIGPAC